MPDLASIEDRVVVGKKGKPIGTIERVLFHPQEPKVIGVQLRPPALGYVIERQPKFFAYDALDFSEAEVTVRDMKGTSGSAAEKRLGIEWDHTVIWRYQDVVTASGERMGQVSDVRFAKDGSVVRVDVSGGMGADVAIGRHTIEVEHIIGFDGDVIRVENVADEKATSGGVAAQAGKSAAIAKHAAKKAADSALKGGIAAARAAKKSETVKRMGKGWRGFTDGFKEGLNGDE